MTDCVPIASLVLAPTSVAPDVVSTLYTNRAMCRFNLSDMEGCISDCDACLALDARSVKAHYFKSKALQSLGADLDAACDHARLAYEACLARGERAASQDMTTQQVLRCRQARWERMERSRRRADADLEREVRQLLAQQAERDLADVPEADQVEREVVREEGQRKMEALAAVFERARAEDDRKRDVPDWLVDDISFNVMLDPVIVSSLTSMRLVAPSYPRRSVFANPAPQTHNGRSYERASIQAAIDANAIDPVTREPLAKGELVPNVRLKEACEWFLEHNGWAYDW